MANISKQELQNNGKWWTWVLINEFDTFIHISDTPITDDEAGVLVEQYRDIHLYDNVPQSRIDIMDYRDAIYEAVKFIKTTNPNLTQWNNYLSQQIWDNAIAIRWFLAVLTKELANRQDLDLSEWTETEVLSKLKIWIINTPARKIEKVLFGIG